MASGTIKNRGWNLMWTNPSPNSNFEPQTLNINGVGNYEEYAVLYKSFPEASMELTTYFLKPAGAFMLYGFVLYSLRRTDCVMTEDTFYIGKGSAWENNTYSENNKYYIPLKIYAR